MAASLSVPDQVVELGSGISVVQQGAPLVDSWFTSTDLDHDAMLEAAAAVPSARKD